MTMRARSRRRRRRFYDQGLAYLHNYVWIEAARSFHQALRHDPNLALAHVGLSYAYIELNKPAQAKQAIDDRAERSPRMPATTIRRHVEARALQMAAEDAPRRPVEAGGVSQGARCARSPRFPNDVELLLQRGIAESPDPADRGQGSVLASIPYYERALKSLSFCAICGPGNLAGASLPGARVREHRPHEGGRRAPRRRTPRRHPSVPHARPHARPRAAPRRPHQRSDRAVRSRRQAAARLPGAGKDRRRVRLAPRAQSRSAGGVVSIHSARCGRPKRC